MNFNFHPPYLQYMQPGHFIQPPQAVNVLPPQAVNVPQQFEEPEWKKSKRDKWTKAQTNKLVAIGHRDAAQPPKVAVARTKEDPDIDENPEKQGQDCESDEEDNIGAPPGSKTTRKRKNLHKEEKDQLDEDDKDTEFMLKLEQEQQRALRKPRKLKSHRNHSMSKH